MGPINQLLLWIATAGIRALALFPFCTGLLASALASYAPLSSNQAIAASENEAQHDTVIIEVDGMTCQGCAPHFDETPKKLKGRHFR